MNNSNKYRLAGLHILVNGIVQMMMTAGVTFAAVHFERISVLWFYLIPAIILNVNCKTKDGDNDE